MSYLNQLMEIEDIEDQYVLDLFDVIKEGNVFKVAENLCSIRKRICRVTRLAIERKLKRPFHYACYSKNYDIVKIFLTYGASALWTNCFRENAFHIVARHSYSVRLLMLLYSTSGNVLPAVNLKDFRNLSPLYYAVKAGKPGFVSKLLEIGANVNAVNGSIKITAAQKACQRKGKPEVLQVLIKHGCDINLVDANGYSAITTAIRSNNLKCVKLLIENGADVAESTTMSRSSCKKLVAHKCWRNVIDMASRTRNSAIMEYLLSLPFAIQLVMNRKMSLAFNCIRMNCPESLNCILSFQPESTMKEVMIEVKSQYVDSMYVESVKKGNTKLLEVLDKHQMRTYLSRYVSAVRLITLSCSCLECPGLGCLMYLLQTVSLHKNCDNLLSPARMREELMVPLRHACLLFNKEQVAVLLQHGADATYYTIYHPLIVELLLTYSSKNYENVEICQMLQLLLNRGGCQSQAVMAFKYALTLEIPFAIHMMYYAAIPYIPAVSPLRKHKVSRRVCAVEANYEKYPTPVRNLIMRWVGHVPSLELLCRKAIRSHLGKDLMASVYNLGVPTMMANWLLISEWQIIEDQERRMPDENIGRANVCQCTPSMD